MKTCVAKSVRTMYIYYALVILPLFGCIFFYEILFNENNEHHIMLRNQANFPMSKMQMISDRSLADFMDKQSQQVVTPKQEEILQLIGANYTMTLPQVLLETDTNKLPLVAREKSLLDVD